MRTTRGAVALAAVLLPLALVSACGESGPTSSTSASSDRAAVSTDPTSQPATQPSPETTETAAPTVAATPTATATATASPTATVAPRWPKALGEPQQGDPVWGVYLAVGHAATDGEVEAAVHDAAKVGYQAVVGDIACDGGAMDALHLDQYDYWSGATLYFARESDARAFAAAYAGAGHQPVGVAHVTVGCLD